MAGIPKLLMSVEEATALLKNQQRRGENAKQHDLDDQSLIDAEKRVEDWERETEQLLLEVFDTNELAEQFSRAAGLYKNLGKDFMGRIQAIGGRVTYKNYELDEIIKRLPEFQQAPKTPVKPDTDFWHLIHPAIAGVTKTRFDSKHYADAIETALKYINEFVKTKVKKKTGKELDLAPLMQFAFSPNNPIITFDDISTETGKNIQQGYMQIFTGAMIGIRNPKAHGIVDIDETRAIHFLFLASLMMHKLDEAS
jgi:uncharacterized protein (TIGR02391 family)